MLILVITLAPGARQRTSIQAPASLGPVTDDRTWQLVAEGPGLASLAQPFVLGASSCGRKTWRRTGPAGYPVRA